MRRIVFITQVVDPADPNLGATTAKIAALAGRVDEVVVLCQRGVDGALPANCRLRRFGAATRPGRFALLLRALATELRGRPVAVIAHMIPLYVVLAAPLVRPRRVPLLLWYSHWKAHLLLRAALRLSTCVATVDERSFPLRSAKVHGIGHGIDMGEFPCRPGEPSPGRSLRVLALGRYTPAKRLEELVEGVGIARARGIDVRIDLHGTTGGPLLERYKSRLELLAGEHVSVNGPIPRTRIAAAYAESDLVASNFESPDKVVFEGCASCRPVVASQATLDRLFAGIEPPLAFERGKPESFADRLQALAALSDEERYAIGKELRERVRKHHSVETWADAILRLADER